MSAEVLIEAIELIPSDTVYDLPSPHLDMLLDKHRVNAFQKAIDQAINTGDIMVDIGTGTGILAVFAARAGAKKVYAIDQNKTTIEWAKEMARVNKVTIVM